MLEYDFRVAGNVESRDAARDELVWITADGATRPDIDHTDGYLAEIRHFVECVSAGRQSDIVPNEQVRLVLEVVEAIRESLETGRAVEL